MKKVSLYCLILCLSLFYLSTGMASEKYSLENSKTLHASGKIHWRPYGQAAFAEAKKTNKPIFLLLTAPSWCYWCHVYTSQAYIYNKEIYPIINQHFIPIYVNADIRQDLTRQYLEGGWPSTTVMTPQKQRLFGFSGPRPIPWMRTQLSSAMHTVQQAKASVSAPNPLDQYQQTMPALPNKQALLKSINVYLARLLRAYDPVHGGFGQGKKFPQGRSLDFALMQYEKSKDPQLLALVEHTLSQQYTRVDNMLWDYRLYDPIEGGFHRYGTQRDWSPPHYEKMLYDNARLVRAYAHLLAIKPEHPLAREVVDKTKHYIKSHWYDQQHGGFYANTDVHGEDAYYGKKDRSNNKPYVDKNKYTDWNSEAILSMIALWQLHHDQDDKHMAEQSLDFFRQHMLSDYGAHHSMTPDGEKGIRGSLLDNSYLLLAFSEAYAAFANPKDLKAANTLAKYSLNNLYNFQGGGFFERNSPDVGHYALGEHIRLTQPRVENGIMAYAFTQLYLQTKEPLYLLVALQTEAFVLQSPNGLDAGYYAIRAAQSVLNNQLLAQYQRVQAQAQQSFAQYKERFWVTQLKNKKVAVSFSPIQQAPTHRGLFILIALIAGFLSFASPCTLPILPAFLAYSLRSSQRHILSMTVLFFIGLTLTFTLLGLSATLFGQFLKEHLVLFSSIAGWLIILSGLWIALGKGIPGIHVKIKSPRHALGALGFGMALGLSWTPCVGPILVAIMILASTLQGAWLGSVLLIFYGIGLALPLMIVAFLLKKAPEHNICWRVIKGKSIAVGFGKWQSHWHTTSLLSGLLFIALGTLMTTGTLFQLNQSLSDSSALQWLYQVEQWLFHFLN